MAQSKLFQPLQIGNINLEHRVIMAPLTRMRADDSHAQLPMAVEYYSQRASTPGGLIIGESSLISAAHAGVPNAAGIWTEDHIQAWKRVTDAVHQKGCFIFSQILSPGRAASPDMLKNGGGHPFLSSSAVPMDDAAPTPEEMSEEQIQAAICDFVEASKNAIAAGFDGVEIHGANGYLIDQFLQDTCNKRTDGWGGNVENRSQFAVKVTTAVVSAIGSERVGFRISPWSEFQGMRMHNPVPQFSYLVKKLKELKLAYLHIIESRVHNIVDVEKTEGIEFALDIWGNTSPVLVAGGFQPDTAKHAIDTEYAANETAVVFGRHFLANPDLPFRISKGLSLNKYDRYSFYTPKQAHGYTDYPFSSEYTAEGGQL